MFKNTTLSVAALAAAVIAIQPIAGANADPVTLSPEIRDVLGTEVLLPTPVTCGAAKRLVRQAGYHKVRKIECDGPVFTFKAKKSGQKWIVTVNKYTKHVSTI